MQTRKQHQGHPRWLWVNAPRTIPGERSNFTALAALIFEPTVPELFLAPADKLLPRFPNHA